jgi:chlorophyllide a reductase subunit Z
MIGGGVTPEGTNIQRFLPRTIDEDQWQCADRAMLWLWTAVRHEEGAASASRAPKAGQKPRVNIIGPATAPSTRRRPGRNPPPGRRHRRRNQHGVPARQPPGRRAAPAVNADVNVCMYREFGRMLCEALERPYLQAPIGLHSTTQIPAQAGRAAGARPGAVHRAREAHHHQADLGPVALGHPGLLRHRQLRRGGQRNLRTRPAPLPRRRAGPAVQLRGVALPGAEDRQRGVRRMVARRPRWSCSAATTSACTWPNAGARASYIPASFPGAIIRRHTGTPFMGYSGATYMMQEVCNALFDALFHILPLATDMDRVDPTPSRISPRRPPLGRRRAASELLDQYRECNAALPRADLRRQAALRDYAAEEDARPRRRRAHHRRAWPCSVLKKSTASAAAR